MCYISHSLHLQEYIHYIWYYTGEYTFRKISSAYFIIFSLILLPKIMYFNKKCWIVPKQSNNQTYIFI
jgi:hypothetical protein